MDFFTVWARSYQFSTAPLILYDQVHIPCQNCIFRMQNGQAQLFVLPSFRVALCARVDSGQTELATWLMNDSMEVQIKVMYCPDAILLLFNLEDMITPTSKRSLVDRYHIRVRVVSILHFHLRKAVVSVLQGNSSLLASVLMFIHQVANFH